MRTFTYTGKNIWNCSSTQLSRNCWLLGWGTFGGLWNIGGGGLNGGRTS